MIGPRYIGWLPTQDDGDIETLIARVDTVSSSEDMSVRQKRSSTLEVCLTDPDLQPGGPGELIPGGLAVPGWQQVGGGLLDLPLPALAVQVVPELAGGGEGGEDPQE